MPVPTKTIGEQAANDRAQNLLVACVFIGGAAAVIHSLHALAGGETSSEWLIFAGLAILTGSFTIKVPSLAARFSVSEMFVFSCAMLFGPAPATLTIVIDGFIVSCWRQHRASWRRHRLQRLLFNSTEGALSIWIASHAFFALAHVPPLYKGTTALGGLLVPLALLTAIYFLLNSSLTALAVTFENGGSPIVLWRKHFLWLSLNYVTGASVALLLVAALRQVSFGAIGVVAPLLVITYLTFRASMGRVDDANQHAATVGRLYHSAVETLAIAIDAKDEVTHGHIYRVQRYAVGLARELGIKEDATLQAIEVAALLHDAGKLAVPEYILNKPGKLTDPEFERMKLHVDIGAEIASAIEFPYPVVPIVRSHHENWDGSGYPDGLSGHDIPIGARILAVVDCFDALTSDRPYRARFSREQALAILRERRGTMYDPAVVDRFFEVQEKLVADTAEIPSHHRALAEISRSALIRPSPSTVPTKEENALGSTEEMLAVCALSRSSSVGSTFTDAAFLVGTHLRRIIPDSACVFYALDPATDDLVVRHAAGVGTAGLKGIRIPLGHRLTGWVAAHRQTIVNSDAALDLDEVGGPKGASFRKCLSMPLLTGDALVGVLAFYSRADTGFTEDQARVAEMLAPYIADILQAALEFEGRRTRDAGDRATAAVAFASKRPLTRRNRGPADAGLKVVGSSWRPPREGSGPAGGQEEP